ncbi:MAG TPA: hypothetical protein VEG38_18390 [Acidimicrobiia bacterium]|nr:hypothetical protein [Acidimicrobiia bacterium]
MSGRTTSTLRSGLILALLYGAVVVVTNLTTGHPVRPLFDGVGGSTPYRWVKPPWYVGNTNIEPKASSTDITFENGVSPLIGVTSDDAQIILNLPQGALPARDGDIAVRAAFTPLDPKKLAKLPGGMRPNGNAYRVQMTYQPSGTPFAQTTSSGNVIMVVPDEAEKMLFSVDGKSWTELPTQRLGDPTTVGSAFNKPGYYVVGTLLPEFPNPNKEDGTKKTVGTVMIVVALALLLGYVLPTLFRRSRAAQAEVAARERPSTRRTRVRRRR